MTQTLRLTFLSLLVSLGCTGAPQEAAAGDSGGLTCEVIPDLMDRYYQGHVRYRDDEATLRDRTVEAYLKRTDGSKTTLLTAEVDQARQSLLKMFDTMESDDCKALTALHDKEVAVAKAQAAFVAKLLKQPGFNVDEKVRLVLDSDKRTRPKTQAEQEALLTKLVHFQLSNYLNSGTELKEAREKLAHRYELAVKRLEEITPTDLYSSFLDAFATALDPHSSYFSAEALEDFRIGMGLSLEGIGAVLTSRDGYTTIEKIVPGGPASRHGKLKTKDKIIAVTQGKEGEAVDVIDMSLRDVVRLIRGKKGTVVTLTVIRQGEKTETLKFSIVRDKIDLKEQAAKVRYETRTVDGRTLNLAVLDLPSFYGGQSGQRQCDEDVKSILKEISEKKVDGLVLDLSRNGGGLLSHAVTISGFFLKTGGVVAVEGPSTSRQVLQDKDEGIQFSGPMVVLTSRVSASASEILAGALKDYHRAIIVGADHTFGKGTVQTVSPLSPSLGALKITTAMFFRPSGVSTQNKGVKADVVLPPVFLNDDYGEKYQDYALPGSRIDNFVSKQANAPKHGWQPVAAAAVQQLVTRSKARVAKDPKFKELQEDIEKARKNRGEVVLGEYLSRTKDDKTDEEKKEDAKSPHDGKDEDDELTAHAEEALNVLADYVTLIGPTASNK